MAFDLDGTLTREDTMREAIARGMGHLDRMRELEARDLVAAVLAGVHVSTEGSIIAA